MTILLRKKSVSKLCFAQKRYGSRETQISIVGRALQERAIAKNAHLSRRRTHLLSILLAKTLLPQAQRLVCATIHCSLIAQASGLNTSALAYR